MKKLLPVILLLCLATAAFGLEFSAGGGMTVGGFSQAAYFEPYWVLISVDSFKSVETNAPIDFSAFFDATYAVASVGFRMNGNTHTKTTTILGASTFTNDDDDHYRSGFLSLSLLGKYPFTLGPLSLFPLLGIEYDLILYYKDETGADLDTTDLSQFWFKLGVGADIVLYKGLSVRPQALLGFKLHNQDERDWIETAQGAPYNATTHRISDFAFEGGVQVGWRF